MSRKRVLVVSSASDTHASAVAYAIRAKGHICEELCCGDYPTLVAISLQVANEGKVCWQSDHHFGKADGEFDSIWLRWRETPILPLSMHPGDKLVAANQCVCALDECIAALDREGVFWVNPFDRADLCSLKGYQLRQARRAGLSVPETLFSNDPDEIKAFIDLCGGVAIHKLPRGAAWQSQDGERLLTSFTSLVTQTDLPADETLRLCPGIFQPVLKKRFEVRVACLGHYLMALSIDSQSDDRAKLDWRIGQWYVDMNPYVLPDHIQQGIRLFLDATGLTFACMDFVVDETGEHVFLEANTKGQFLWMEERAGLPLLEAFTQYLLAGNKEFSPHALERGITWAEFKRIWDEGLRYRVQQHAPAPHSLAVPDYIS